MNTSEATGAPVTMISVGSGGGGLRANQPHAESPASVISTSTLNRCAHALQRREEGITQRRYQLPALQIGVTCRHGRQANSGGIRHGPEQDQARNKKPARHAWFFRQHYIRRNRTGGSCSQRIQNRNPGQGSNRRAVIYSGGDRRLPSAGGRRRPGGRRLHDSGTVAIGVTPIAAESRRRGPHELGHGSRP